MGAWDGQSINIVELQAIGGSGKTALVTHFVEQMRISGWRGATRVYAWSFYSQGTDETHLLDKM